MTMDVTEIEIARNSQKWTVAARRSFVAWPRAHTLRDRCTVALELGHAAYRVPRPPIVQRFARQFLESVALHPQFDDRKCLSSNDRDRVLDFLYWLLPGSVLPSEQFRFCALVPRSIRPLYRPLNPSIQRVSRGYIVNVRTVNFQRDANCVRYESRERDGIVRTRNIHLRLSRDLSTVEPNEVEVVVPEGALTYSTRNDVQGLEDARLVMANDALKTRWLTATVYGLAREPTMCLARVGTGGVVDFVRRMIGYQDDRCQKSWLPFFDGQRLRCIYGYSPRVVLLDIDMQTARVDVWREVDPGCNTCRFRGGGGPVFARDAAYVLVHEVLWFGGKRTYTHRLLEFDPVRWALRRVSPMFCFKHVGVEYAAGMTLAHGDEGLVVTFGLDDREAWLVVLSWEWIDAQLYYSNILLSKIM